jgi:hypothetical protein
VSDIRLKRGAIQSDRCAAERLKRESKGMAVWVRAE